MSKLRLGTTGRGSNLQSIMNAAGAGGSKKRLSQYSATTRTLSPGKGAKGGIPALRLTRGILVQR